MAMGQRGGPVSPVDDSTSRATTLIFRGIPRKYTKDNMIWALMRRMTSQAFDFVHVPWDRRSTHNMGFAFVNFVDAAIARMVLVEMQGTLWPQDPRIRPMRIMVANVQGLIPNILRYVSCVHELDLANCPEIFVKGKPMPFQQVLEYIQERYAWQRGMVESKDHACILPPLSPDFSEQDVVDTVSTTHGLTLNKNNSRAFSAVAGSSGEFLSTVSVDTWFDDYNFASGSSVSSQAAELPVAGPLEAEHLDLVRGSPAYARSWVQVTSLLHKLKAAGAF